MKTLKSYILFKLCLAAFLLLVATHTLKAQQTGTYNFHYEESEVQGYSIRNLFCLLNYSELTAYNKVRISFNDKTKTYQVKKLSKANSKEYKPVGDLIYFKIDDYR